MPRPRKLPEGIKLRNGEYHADFYAQGRRIRKRLSGDLGVAVELLHELQARADRADFGLLDNDYGLAELKEKYLRDCKQRLKPKSYRRYEKCFKKLDGKLGANRVSQLTTDNVVLYRQERLDEGASPRTVNMEVGALSTMLRWGIKPAGLIGSNPIEHLSPLPHDHPKEGRALSDAEVKRLLDASGPPWRDIWYAFLVTGLRRDELAGLTFRDIDRENRELVVRSGSAKNHTSRRIPIDDGLWAILEKQTAGRDQRRPGVGTTAGITKLVEDRFDTDHIFVSTQNTPFTHESALYSAFIRCCHRAGIETRTKDAQDREIDHVDLHSLRRTFATALIVNGADPKSVQELLGHKTLVMTMKIYAKVHAQTKRQAIGKLPYGRGSEGPDRIVQFPGKVV